MNAIIGLILILATCFGMPEFLGDLLALMICFCSSSCYRSLLRSALRHAHFSNQIISLMCLGKGDGNLLHPLNSFKMRDHT